ncbi:hypothetical protein [Moraxella pluranimalium]|uniref:Uncharacterized protein n=1 Tax=Moraxella pluranimalium TaxID=470453 RepID=A0A1T0CQN6_9GAMM|nr:hypothetical protein [Moraxella pluranimalium]OOS24660.1 hypothetical protein B0680_04330 [Moraxella pluranimalium]
MIESIAEKYSQYLKEHLLMDGKTAILLSDDTIVGFDVYRYLDHKEDVCLFIHKPTGDKFYLTAPEVNELYVFLYHFDKLILGED